MSSDTVERLRRSFLFRGLPEDVLAALAQKVSGRRLAEGEALFRKGDRGDSLFIIDDGWVKIVTESAEGGELTLNRCGPGEIIGEMSLLDDAPRSAGVVALADAEVLELRREAFIELLEQRPDLALQVIRGISSRLRFSTTYIEKAIEWSKKISEGDYSFVEQSQPAQELKGQVSDEDKAGQLLSAFFQMVRNVKQREDELRQQLQKLTLEIDEARRKREFEELISTDFYANLREQARKLRQKRAEDSS